MALKDDLDGVAAPRGPDSRMAKAKKTTKKVSKTSRAPVRAKKAPARKARARRSSPARLDPEVSSKLLRPPSDFDDTIERFAAAWSGDGRAVRVPGVTPSKLVSALAKAQKAAARYEAERLVLERKLGVLRDAKALAADEAWRGLLDAWAIVKAHLRRSPELAEAFAFMSDAFPGGPGGPRRAPEPPTGEG
ncbi:MAG: hypothetical protein IT378_08050 [Sandaracinaceae bacterium]|nr:hypothetical protein [Sandaracinaceae bacterium]